MTIEYLMINSNNFYSIKDTFEYKPVSVFPNQMLRLRPFEKFRIDLEFDKPFRIDTLVASSSGIHQICALYPKNGQGKSISADKVH